MILYTLTLQCFDNSFGDSIILGDGIKYSFSYIIKCSKKIFKKYEKYSQMWLFLLFFFNYQSSVKSSLFNFSKWISIFFKLSRLQIREINKCFKIMIFEIIRLKKINKFKIWVIYQNFELAPNFFWLDLWG